MMRFKLSDLMVAAGAAFVIFGVSIASPQAVTPVHKAAGRVPVAGSGMSVRDVIRLAKAGVSDDLIVAQIRTKRASFDLTTDQLLDLKAASVSDRVIRAMIEAPTPSAVVNGVHPVAAEEPAPVARKADAQSSPSRPAPTKPNTAVVVKTPATQIAMKWVSHDDPAGFALKVPAGWDLRADRQAGRIQIQGPDGQHMVIWPMFIEQPQLDPKGAGVLVAQLARRVNPNMDWETPKVNGDTARASARGQTSGAALLRWSSAPQGTAVFLFAVSAPSGVYAGSVGVFATVLGSFRVVPDANTPAAAPSGTAAQAEHIAWVRWTDPREGAFSASVPQGWTVSGGAFRQSATDIRKNVVLSSPDGKVRITVGDASVGSYTAPNAMFSRVGLREGGYTTLGDGSRLQIRRFVPAQQFVRQYVQTSLRSQCADLRILEESERQDLATNAVQQARAQGAPSPHVTAAGVSFSCTWNGQPARGYYAAATILPFPGRGGIWYVDALYGFLAAAERGQQAEDVSRHVLQSMGINSNWKQREDQIAGNAVQQDNARSAEIQARARKAIAEDQQKTSDMIVKGYQARSQVYDEIARKRENAILGTVDVVDPSSGKQYKIDNYSDYHWMNNQGVIAGTKTDNSPGADWREMITLP